MPSIRTVALSGIGGYGEVYGKALLEEGESHGLTLTGCIDPYPASCSYLGELRARHIPVYASLDAFYREQTADLLCISAPIHLHAEQTCQALAHGSHVLCEKPLCATLAEAGSMEEARRAAGREVAIGFQFAFNPAILALREAIWRGTYGAPRLFKAMSLPPRDSAYYRRGWAGRVQVGGHIVCASVANNACAHYLHLLFFLASPPGRPAQPLAHQTELYRANAIETFDTITARIQTDSGVPRYFAASHAVDRTRLPGFVLELENARITCRLVERTLLVETPGRTFEERLAPDPLERDKIWAVAESLRRGEPPACGLPDALAHTRYIHDIQHSCAVTPFAPALLTQIPSRTPGETITCARGLFEAMETAYDAARLLSETGYLSAARR